jgi:hypothetical protein
MLFVGQNMSSSCAKKPLSCSELRTSGVIEAISCSLGSSSTSSGRSPGVSSNHTASARFYKKQRDSRRVFCPIFCADNHSPVRGSDKFANIRFDLGEAAIVHHPHTLTTVVENMFTLAIRIAHGLLRKSPPEHVRIAHSEASSGMRFLRIHGSPSLSRSAYQPNGRSANSTRLGSRSIGW